MNLNSKSRFHQNSMWKHINCTAYNVHIGFVPTRIPHTPHKPLHPNMENPKQNLNQAREFPEIPILPFYIRTQSYKTVFSSLYIPDS